MINCEFSFEPVGSMEKEQNCKTIGAHLIMPAKKTTLQLNLEADDNESNDLGLVKTRDEKES